MEQVRLKTSFEYPFLQALYNPLGGGGGDDLSQFLKVLQTSLITRSPRGCLESFLEVLQRALHMSIEMRYGEKQSDEKS